MVAMVTSSQNAKQIEKKIERIYVTLKSYPV